MENARRTQCCDDANDRRGRQVARPNRPSDARGLQIHWPAHPRRQNRPGRRRKRGASIGEQVRAMYKKLGREFWPVRENLHLSDEQKANAVKRVAVDASTLAGRKVISIDRTDGAKFVFEDGSWMLLRLSGTEPLLRLYVEAESAAASAKLTREASQWVLQN